MVASAPYPAFMNGDRIMASGCSSMIFSSDGASDLPQSAMLPLATALEMVSMLKYWASHTPAMLEYEPSLSSPIIPAWTDE